MLTSEAVRKPYDRKPSKSQWNRLRHRQSEVVLRAIEPPFQEKYR